MNTQNMPAPDGATPAHPIPVEADLAKTDVGLIDFAKKAGKNIFSVIPDATRTQSYLKGPAKIHYVCDPDMVTELLAGVGRRFPKAEFTHNVIGPVVGNGMILSEGEKWRAQRHRYAPLFAARNLPVLTWRISLRARRARSMYRMRRKRRRSPISRG